MLDHIEEWLYTHLAGIQNAGTGYDTVVVRPFVPADLDSLTASVKTSAGLIRSEFRKEKANGQIVFRFTIPQGCRATAILPDGSQHKLTEGEVTTIHQQIKGVTE